MSTNAQLLVKTGRYLNGELSFRELAEWVQEREESWVSLPGDSLARVLADTIMLAAYELSGGARDESSVAELLSQMTLQASPKA